MKKFYVGYKQDASREVFKSNTKPTEKTHGNLYLAVSGPFLKKEAESIVKMRKLENLQTRS